MRLPSPLGKRTQSVPYVPYGWEASADGLHFRTLNSPTAQPPPLTRALKSPGVEALLEQLVGDDLAKGDVDGYSITWPDVHTLLGSRLYETSLELLEFPEIIDIIPKLQSHRGLIDPDFAVRIAGWAKRDGSPISLEALSGGMVMSRGEPSLLALPIWCLTDAITRFADRSSGQRTAAENRKAWGKIRNLALDAEAFLDQFLVRSVVVTPETLDVDFRRAKVADETIVEILPTFQGAPERWLEYFDDAIEVPEDFNIPTASGVVHVALSEPVRSVLREIKRWPGRRAAGPRAEAFLLNPTAALGDAAAAVIDINQFEEAKSQAGIKFDRFRPAIELDSIGYPQRIGLHIDTAQGSPTHHPFTTDNETRKFVVELQKRLKNKLQILAWKNYEFELDGDAVTHLSEIETALKKRTKPPIAISHDSVFDLTRYSERVKSIGKNQEFFSIYIVQKSDEEGWFPSKTPHPERGEPDPGIRVVLSPNDLPKLEQEIRDANARGDEKIAVPGYAEPLPLRAVETAAQALKRSLEEPSFDSSTSAPETGVDPRDRPTLLIKGNIDEIDHNEDRAQTLNALQAEFRRPECLKPETKLRDYQVDGVARLQNLFSVSPTRCRGVLLADDMGLGKTVQLLTFIASEFERDPHIPPAIIVAPVSLLENWKKEIVNFFQEDALRVLTAYGDELFRLRVPRESVSEELRKEGLVRFLKDGWRGDAQIVLTTYETLRDLEFSFAGEPWSILVCDEAQKVKNPNAMVTRAAKKLNVRFRVACTGTPVENSLVDIWCLFDLIQPGMLGALNDFGSRYGRPIESGSDTSASAIDELRRLIEPQVIRRTKKDVAKDLKEKIFEKDGRRLEMSPEQRALYVGAIGRLRMGEDSDGDGGSHHFSILQYLRLVCADPREYETDAFVPESPTLYRRKSPKMNWLLDALHRIKTADKIGEKALIFAENREIQRMLQHYIHAEFGVKPQIVNGETAVSTKTEQSRQKIITRFQESPGFGVLILSPIAVGYGVNIQAANHVIHFLRHWNPAKEDQATDRAYRIGQKKDVHVYCPLSTATDFKTFDVKLDELLDVKRRLAADMLHPAGEIRMSEIDLSEIVPGEIELPPDQPVTLDKLERMKGQMFEALAAALWQKQGYETYLTPGSGDAGVDVVGIRGREGVLIQCKSSTSDVPLGWQAARDVKGGADIYADRHPTVKFTLIGLTNKRFNASAHTRSRKSGVILMGQADLWRLIEKYPLGMNEIKAKFAEAPRH